MGVIGGGVAALLIAAFAAAFGAFGASRCGPIDRPVARSSHVRPRPRAGGLAVVLGVGAGLVALALGVPPGMEPAHAALILAACGAGALLGLADDLSLVGLRTKFLGLAAISLLVALVSGPVPALDLPGNTLVLPFWAALLGSALWVFVVANAVNFMDGSDGMLAAGLGVPALALAVLGALLGAPGALLCGALLAGGLLGFALFNMPCARVFAGDVGSLFGGMTFAAGALDLARLGPPGAVWIVPLLLAPFLADVFATLIARARRRAPLMHAHREHLYQRLIARGWPHWKASAAYAAAAALSALAGWAALAAGGPAGTMAALALIAGGGLCFVSWLSARLERAAAS